HRQLAVAFDPDHGVEGVVLQVADDDLIHARLEPEKNVAQQIVRHRAGSLHFFDFESNGVCFVNADPDGEDRVTLHIFQDDDRHVLSATYLPRALRISVQAISRLLRFEFFAAIPSTRRGDGFFLLREWRRPWIQQGYSGAENI